MDLNQIKQKLESLQTQSNTNKGNGKSIFWKPSVGKQQVRIVPNKYNKSFPFTEMQFYYGIGQRVMASPMNWGEKDPIQEFTKQLRDSGDKENWYLAKKLDAKTRIFAPVLVRGEEEEGVKLWQFGKEVYQAFLNLAADAEVGDYTDVSGGRDIKLTTVGPEVTGTPYNKTTVSPSMKQSPISDNTNVVERSLDTQPNPIEVFKRLTFDEVKANLETFLKPEGGEEGEISSEKSVPFDGDSKNNYSLEGKDTTSKGDKFDNLFDDKKSNSGDDLPF
jgi:hypothetical protein|tara:strand:- start:396 stop:1223 length:828 start_codon:yes stop_codon:yes gene_type:complete